MPAHYDVEPEMDAIVREYSASETDLVTALLALEADALTLGLEHRSALTLVLMLEELYTNSLKYGGLSAHAGLPGSSAAVIVSLQRLSAELVELVYEDAGLAHDPFAGAAHAHIDAATDDRPVGRLGILLLQRLSRHVTYEYRHGRNRVSMQVAIDTSPADFQSP